MPMREIVVVEQRLAAGVRRQRVQRVLRSLEVVVDAIAAAPVYMPDAARDALRGIAHRRLRHQAAGVDREEGDVGADRGVDGRLQLRLVVDAVETQAAGEVDQHLLLVQRARAS